VRQFLVGALGEAFRSLKASSGATASGAHISDQSIDDERACTLRALRA
jgi:hypothetical protein